ncbi:hypothetical protein [Lysinibacillus antri]|uniref:Uncharacterized protein n=1 Tax=Lysinibacillus antri TaxID=2498145 RepID=A0A3S0P8U3_9BACI|nr:hypothetical protein [Lysinibacillus antri]RUL57109.1 hypothetical protein EK386_01435 [Lysinibacillus antri]
MTTKVPMANNALNILSLKESMDEIIFNYIDTSKNWEKAYSSIGELLDDAVEYFSNYVKGNNGQLPNENTYWVLFMDLTSKLLYFQTLAFFRLKLQRKEVVSEEIKTLFLLAANCIPDVQKIVNAQFLNEVGRTYEEIELYDGKEGGFERLILKQNNRAKDCLEAFSNYIHKFHR